MFNSSEKSKALIRWGAVALCSGLLAACNTTQLTGDVYNRQEARLVQEVFSATIKSMRAVVIEAGETGQGASVGATAGGLLGSTHTGSSTQQGIAIVGGGLLGGLLGSQAEAAGRKVQGTEFLLTMEDGRQVVVVQQDGKDRFVVGQKVRLLQLNGQVRVTPDA